MEFDFVGTDKTTDQLLEMKNFSKGTASSAGEFDSSLWLKSFDSLHQ